MGPRRPSFAPGGPRGVQDARPPKRPPKRAPSDRNRRFLLCFPMFSASSPRRLPDAPRRPKKPPR
eukprot:9339738-Pyramimonas_sp.AAC.1